MNPRIKGLLLPLVLVATGPACKTTEIFAGELHDEWRTKVDEKDDEIRRLQLLTHGCDHAYRAARAELRAKRTGQLRSRRQVLFDKARFHFGQAREYFEQAHQLLPADTDAVKHRLSGCVGRGRPPAQSYTTK